MKLLIITFLFIIFSTHLYAASIPAYVDDDCGINNAETEEQLVAAQSCIISFQSEIETIIQQNEQTSSETLNELNGLISEDNRCKNLKNKYKDNHSAAIKYLAIECFDNYSDRMELALNIIKKHNQSVELIDALKVRVDALKQKVNNLRSRQSYVRMRNKYGE
jgi:hypothetical protein